MLKFMRAPARRYLQRRSETRLQQRVFAAFQAALATGPTLDNLILPSQWGKGLPERVVELLLAYLTYQAGAKVLDVGHSNAMSCHLNMLKCLPAPRHLTGLDIAVPTYDTTPFYAQSRRADIADATTALGQFDLIWCISTLEHIGLNNAGYTADFCQDDQLDIKAFSRMLNLLTPGGTLLVTSPYGKAENHDWLRNYDKARWQQLVALAARVGVVKEWYFRHTFGAGWQLADPIELRYVGYYDQHNAGAGALAALCVKT